MKLLRFASAVWQVLLVYDRDDNCVVLDFLSRVDAHLRKKMLNLLKEHVPLLGPPSNKEKSRHLDGPIWEFKADPKQGPECE